MLITKSIQKKLPRLYANENLRPEQTKVPLKLFNPCGSQSWFVTEMNPETGEMFGYVTGMGFDELGYIDLNELKSLRLPFGLSIERDIHWNENTTLDKVMNGEVR
jgi:hypothetical protein